MSGAPVSPLAGPAVLVIAGSRGQARITLSGAPSTWPAAIDAQAGATGVEALITSAATVLDDGSQADPLGDGYLLLYSQASGAGAFVEVRAESRAAALGFTLTPSYGAGRDAGEQVAPAGTASATAR